MRVGVPGGDIVFVQSLGFVQQLLAGTQGFGQRLEQDGNRMSPRHAARFLDHRFDGFFGALLGGKASPLIVAGVERMMSVGEISPTLFHPIRVSAGHKDATSALMETGSFLDCFQPKNRAAPLDCCKHVPRTCPF